MPERAWTDLRLDELNEKVDKGFAAADKKMDDGFAAAHKKMDDGFAAADRKMDLGFAAADKRMDLGFAAAHKKMDAGFEKVDADIRELRGYMNRLLVALLAVGGGIIAALLKSHGL